MIRQRGFTLVELLVVLAILAILIAIVVPVLTEVPSLSELPTIRISGDGWSESLTLERDENKINVPCGVLKVHLDFPRDVEKYTVSWGLAELEGVSVERLEEGDFQLVVPFYSAETWVATLLIEGPTTRECSVAIHTR